MNLIKFSLINLARNKKTSTTIGLLMILGLCSLMFSYSFIKMSFYGLGEQMIHQGIGHFQIQDNRQKEEENEYPLEFGIDDKSLENIKQILKKHDQNIEAIMPKLEFSGLISTEYKSEIFIGNGIDSRSEDAFSSVFIKIVEGKNMGLDFDNPKKDEVLIGNKLAKKLSIKVGDIITLMVSATDGALNAIDCEVSGTFSTGIAQIDKRLVMLPVYLAKELMKTEKLSKLSVGLYDTYKAKQISEEVAKELEGSQYSVYLWDTLAPFYKKVVSLYLSFFIFLGGIIIFIVVSSVLGSVSNMVSQKTKEIGMLKATGFSNKDIISLVLYEVFILSVVASVIAFIVSHIGMFVINNLGLSMPPPPGSDNGYPLAFMPIFTESLFMCGALIIISLLSALKPSLEAGNLKIADALRG